MNRKLIPPSHSPKGRTPNHDGAAGRERLLDAAVHLFSTHGIARTTIAQIAATARVTSAMVHYWFSTREKLLDAVVKERLGPQIGAIWRPADVERESAIALVQGLLERMFQVTAAAPWLPSLWLREIIQVGGLLQERVLKRIPQDLNLAFRTKIAQAQARGEINPQLDPNLLFVSMLALVMLPQAAATGWQKVPGAQSSSREQVQSHVHALLTVGLSIPSSHRGEKADQ
ncbi:TetR/AcrR family transcriptional regulator [Pseudomonas protegens]|uniref:TetR/AcrR family transcriptional regulator n=1 Tax=Pseudomonas protegens TaxID=380021 RepID=UPI003906C64B